MVENENACKKAVHEFLKQKETDAEKILSLLVEQEKYDWANWLITRCMTYTQYVSYAVFAAEQVIDIFAKKYPDDTRPQQAIAAAKKCIAHPTIKNKKAAYAAASAAASAAAAYAASYAAAIYTSAATYTAASSYAAAAAYASSAAAATYTSAASYTSSAASYASSAAAATYTSAAATYTAAAASSMLLLLPLQ